MRYSYLLAALSGLLQVLMFPSFGYFLLGPVSLVPLLLAIAGESGSRKQFLLGWIAGAIFWGGACYWIYDVMHRYAHLPAPAAAAIFIGFFLAKGLHLGLFSVLAAPLLKTRWAIPAVAVLWVALEGTHQYLGFTWLHLGNAGIHSGEPTSGVRVDVGTRIHQFPSHILAVGWPQIGFGALREVRRASSH